MRYGAVFPTSEIGSDPAAVRDFAQAAEDLGYSHLVVYDHVLGAVQTGREPPLRGFYDEHDEFHEPLVLFGYLAAVTTTLTLATGVLILPQRQTVLVAKQAAQVQLLSRGRLRLGVGTGWNPVEYEALGVPFADRGARLDEQIRILRELWRGGVVDFAGDYHRIDRAALVPPASSIPIWLGGRSAAALHRSATVGDGHIFSSSDQRELDAAHRLVAALSQHGRRKGFGVDAITDWSKGPERWLREAALWREAGATDLSVRTMTRGADHFGVRPAGLADVTQHITALEQFITTVRSA